MGDPTLRMHPSFSSNLSGAVTSTAVTLSWAPSTDSNLQGYYVYRANAATDRSRAFRELAITGTTCVDSITAITLTWCARSNSKLEQRDLFNPSQGIFFSTGNSANSIPAPSAPTTVAANAASSSQIDLTWVDTANMKMDSRSSANGRCRNLHAIATSGANAVSYNDTGLSSGTQYFYRIRSYNVTGDSAYSSETSATTGTAVASIASATLLTTTQRRKEAGKCLRH